MITIKKISTLIILVAFCSIAQAQERWSSAQKEIITAIQKFSESTAVNGQGAEAYASFLCEDFSRWTIGSESLSDKENWVKGIGDWFEEGWRVSDRKQKFIEISIQKDMAYVRRIVSKTYLGPDGSTSSSKAALVETWKKADEMWLLCRTNVQPIQDK